MAIWLHSGISTFTWLVAILWRCSDLTWYALGSGNNKADRQQKYAYRRALTSRRLFIHLRKHAFRPVDGRARPKVRPALRGLGKRSHTFAAVDVVEQERDIKDKREETEKYRKQRWRRLLGLFSHQAPDSMCA